MFIWDHKVGQKTKNSQFHFLQGWISWYRICRPFLRFLDPEIAPFLRFLDPEFFLSIFTISGSRNGSISGVSGSRNCTISTICGSRNFRQCACLHTWLCLWSVCGWVGRPKTFLCLNDQAHNCLIHFYKRGPIMDELEEV